MDADEPIYFNEKNIFIKFCSSCPPPPTLAPLSKENPYKVTCIKVRIRFDISLDTACKSCCFDPNLSMQYINNCNEIVNNENLVN